MLTITDKKYLKDYMQDSNTEFNTENEIKNFRLFYHGKKTNLIWYDGKVMYIPREHFEFKNLINLELNKQYKCALYSYEMKLIQELQEKKISFVLEDSLEDIMIKIKSASISLMSDDVAIESLYYFDYSKVIEPIYLGNGTWLNIQ